MWFKIQDNNVIIFILAKPNAKKSKLVEISEDRLHIMLQAKPQSGEANKVLISYISKIFRVPKSQVSILKGMTGRYKQACIPWSEKIQLLLDNPERLKE